MPIRIALLGLISFLIAATIACSTEGDAAEPTPDDRGGPPVVAIDKPPAATASAGSVSVPTGTGTYCWSSGSTPGMCVDMAGPVTGAQELQVAAGAEVTITTPFPVTDAVVSAFVPQGQPTLGNAGELNWSFPPINRLPLDSTVDAAGIHFNADLAPGRYIVTAFVKAAQGDASYGIVLNVS